MKKFELGQLVMTKGIEKLIIEDECENTQEIARCVIRHSKCDWGELCEEDKQTNDFAVENGERIL